MNITTELPPSRKLPTPVQSATPGATTELGSAGAPLPAARASGREAVTLFRVTFDTEMSELDLAMLARALDLSTNVRSMANPREDDLGFARLDHSSGLFLRRTMAEGQWMLEARTWGHPAAQTVHGWHVLAVEAARQLDPTVSFPDRLHVDARDIPDRQVGRNANKRLAQIRRRLVGLS